jgi:hypothetical protein
MVKNGCPRRAGAFCLEKRKLKFRIFKNTGAKRKRFQKNYYTPLYSCLVAELFKWAAVTLYRNQLPVSVMKSLIKHPFNPIHRDLLIVLGASLGAAVIIVSAAFMIFG